MASTGMKTSILKAIRYWILLCIQQVVSSALTKGTPQLHESFLSSYQFDTSLGVKQIACVGDSITHGSKATSEEFNFPGRLQQLLDQVAPGEFKITNLGSSGSTLMRTGNLPYWRTESFADFVSRRWDIILIMLGTNDAKDRVDGGPENWHHDCVGERALNCEFSRDYNDLINVSNGLGKHGVIPEIFIMIPPPLMKKSAYGMNQTVINKIYPNLLRQIAAHNGITTERVVDLNTALGGGREWKNTIPNGGCTIEKMHEIPCIYFCSSTECDQCHPSDFGYFIIAHSIFMQFMQNQLIPRPPGYDFSFKKN